MKRKVSFCDDMCDEDLCLKRTSWKYLDHVTDETCSQKAAIFRDVPRKIVLDLNKDFPLGIKRNVTVISI